MEELEISFDSVRDAINHFSQILPDPATTDLDSIIEVFTVIGHPRRFIAMKRVDGWSVAMII